MGEYSIVRAVRHDDVTPRKRHCGAAVMHNGGHFPPGRHLLMVADPCWKVGNLPPPGATWQPKSMTKLWVERARAQLEWAHTILWERKEAASAASAISPACRFPSTCQTKTVRRKGKRKTALFQAAF